MTLVVHPHFHHRWTGVSRHTFGIVPALRTLGLEVACAGSHLAPGLSKLTVREVLARAKTETVVWHAHRNNELLWGLALRWLRPNLKVVATRHGSYQPSGWTRFISRHADALVTLNAENAGWMKQSSVVVPHGVDTARFFPPASRVEAWRALGLGGTHGVGVVGRVRENKGQLDFARAVGPLLPHYREWRAAVVGLVKFEDRAYASEIRRATNGEAWLAGEHDDVERWYQGLSVLVNPSHGESFGLTMIEGMAAGCCVVSSKLFHTADYLEHGRTGFTFPAHDVEALRLVLEELFQKPGLVAKIGAQAAEAAKARFGIEHEAKALAEVYGEVLRGVPREAGERVRLPERTRAS